MFRLTKESGRRTSQVIVDLSLHRRRTGRALFIWAAQHPNPKQTSEPPPEFLGWIFIGLGSFFFLLGLAMATCILMAGRSLDKRTRYWFAFIVGCIECIFIPFGTILGVFTIIVVSRQSVKTLFSTATGEPER